MAITQFYAEQKIPSTLDEVWDFISSPKNLKKITPPHMGFHITSKDLSDKMYEGMIISYKVSPLPGYRTNWMTEITHIKEGKYFVDEQRLGPYKIWHHEHFIEPIKNGVLMKDLITYVPPFGIFGSIANHILIKNQVRKIFEYRKKALIEIYGDYQ
jgi:ligand-binding SRPBCC domain-containing protein